MSRTTSSLFGGARMGYSRTGRARSGCRDPDFAAKVVDVVGLYLDPPAGGVVLSVDEKTQVQALDRTQPLLPVSFGKTEKRTHDYKRNGTTKLFAALDTGTRGGDRQVPFPPPGPPVPQVHGRDSGQAPRQGNSCNPR